MQRRTSLVDIARALKLASSTVSRALADSGQISKATRQRVHEMASRLGYQPNQSAAALRRGHSRTLGVLVPRITGSFFPEIVNGIAIAARRAGYTVMIEQSQEDVQQEKKALTLLLNAQVAGVLVSIATTTRNHTHFDLLRQTELPLVFFDRVPEEVTGTHISSVGLDEYAGAYAAVEHLLAEGHRRIAHFAGPLHIGIFQRRHQGYLAALRDNSIAFEEGLLYMSELDQSSGAAGMQRLLSLPNLPDAIFSSSDLAMVGAMQVAQAHGLHIPKDMALAGFSNAHFSRLTAPPLTTVDQCSHEMGQLAVRQLLKMINNQAGTLAAKPVVLQPQLLVRASSKRTNDQFNLSAS